MKINIKKIFDYFSYKHALECLPFKDFIKLYWEERLAFFAIVIAVIAFALAATNIATFIFVAGSRAKTLELVGTATILAGAFWTAIGVSINKKDSALLDQMAKNDKLDAKEIVRILNGASNFATSGCLMVFFGSVMLLIKIKWF